MSETEHRPFPPVFATNHPDTGETVAHEINRLLKGLRTDFANPPQLAFATAYMNPQGFELIADEVEKAPHVRLLLGADPEEPYRSRRSAANRCPSMKSLGYILASSNGTVIYLDSRPMLTQLRTGLSTGSDRLMATNGPPRRGA